MPGLTSANGVELTWGDCGGEFETSYTCAAAKRVGDDAQVGDTAVFGGNGVAGDGGKKRVDSAA
ncbi:hypothetical protein SBA5_240009 [Candidatus Sulfotelmatomonas gaucii]|uniref:Uncharacterized protein n=1 Tax=Candidatus Sulfuritelmatomonas gaucii TaxID=2043161 RepID=A0A2N9L837_9BACT|nr:hypothetical protein SBA5_240009 [Candidatus Sulfotelmatomonas gaucii]